MKKIMQSCCAAFCFAAMAASLAAQTSLDQLLEQGPATEVGLPQPVAEASEPQRGSLEEAQKKLPLFNYQKADVLSVKRGTPDKQKKHTEEKIELTINDPLRQLGEFKQEFIYYRTQQPGPRPTVLVFPPFCPQKVDDLSATYFTKKGYNAIIIAPSESLTDTTRPLDKVDDMLIRGVIVARMCIDMLETFPEVDKDRIYAYGISMGGIRTSLTFGVEPRIKKALEIVGGAYLPDIIADTKFKLLKGLRDTRMEAEGIKNVEDLRTYMRRVTTIDPVDFAVLRNPEDIFLVLGHGDRLVPDVYQKKLYAAFSRPKEGRYPRVKRSALGHYLTAAKFMRYINIFVDFVER